MDFEEGPEGRVSFGVEIDKLDDHESFHFMIQGLAEEYQQASSEMKESIARDLYETFHWSKGQFIEKSARGGWYIADAGKSIESIKQSLEEATVNKEDSVKPPKTDVLLGAEINAVHEQRGNTIFALMVENATPKYQRTKKGMRGSKKRRDIANDLYERVCNRGSKFRVKKKSQNTNGEITWKVISKKEALPFIKQALKAQEIRSSIKALTKNEKIPRHRSLFSDDTSPTFDSKNSSISDDESYSDILEEPSFVSSSSSSLPQRGISKQQAERVLEGLMEDKRSRLKRQDPSLYNLEPVTESAEITSRNRRIWNKIDRNSLNNDGFTESSSNSEDRRKEFALNKNSFGISFVRMSSSEFRRRHFDHRNSEKYYDAVESEPDTSYHRDVSQPCVVFTALFILLTGWRSSLLVTNRGFHNVTKGMKEEDFLVLTLVNTLIMVKSCQEDLII